MTALSKDRVGLLQALRAAETDDDEIRALLLSAENYVARDVRFEATMAAERVGEDPTSSWEEVAVTVLDTGL